MIIKYIKSLFEEKTVSKALAKFYSAATDLELAADAEQRRAEAAQEKYDSLYAQATRVLEDKVGFEEQAMKGRAVADRIVRLIEG